MMSLKLAIALALFGAVSLTPAFANANQLLISCAPTESQGSSSQQEPSPTPRS